MQTWRRIESLFCSQFYAMAKKQKKQRAPKAPRQKKQKTGEGWAKFKDTMGKVFNAVKGKEEGGTAFSATTSRDIVVKTKRTRPKETPGGMDYKKFLIPGLAIAAAALLILKKKK